MHTPKRSAATVLLRSLFWVIPMMVAAYFLFRGFTFNQLAKQSASWPRTAGTVTSVAVREERSRRSTWFDAWVSYRYEVGAETYTAEDGPYLLDRYTAEMIDDREAMKRARERFPEGRRIEVAYDPLSHGRSTLQAGQHQRALGSFFIGFAALAIGISMVWNSWKGHRKPYR
ncbi:MAG: DUF3592 domain-containing protein [Candidatus Peribacteraceae bacterium]|nr:DUF3592 domain-containing protein [Candidatus Peribacteraceae bacterium]